ncbi:O-antigen ligase domain-containing protein [Chlorogloeopsis sp. ULAP02]|uniref:O-antigen ligase domain-containing protein n=1 Tax=Chlorogloeopsis sp. ULAP02 TaxID=3107926 RepID=UPI00313515F7
MNPLVYVVIFGWIPFVLFLFRWMPTQKAVILSFIIAWLFLPVVSFELPGIPNYTKIVATCYGILLATIVFDVKRFSSFHFGWLDVPMLVWCLSPLPSSMTNDLGLYDGLSGVFYQVVTWGLPYYLGRLYLGTLDGLRKLATYIFIGGLIYIPLCLFELRMSPQLHRVLYGFHARSDFTQTMRYGGYRPTVFMEHGLMVGAWMMAAALIGIWLWKTEALKQVWGIPIKWLVAALLLTNILVKSTGAILLLLVGLCIIFFSTRFRTSILVLMVIAAISLHLYLGVTGNFPGEQIVAVVSTTLNEERAQSVEFRFDNEKILSERAREKMVFGWGGWGRNEIYDKWGKRLTITDSLWIIAFGIRGVVGLIAVMASLLLPAIAFMQHYPVSIWNHPKVAPAAALVILLILYTIDCLLNALINPIYILACGGIAGLVINQTKNQTKPNLVQIRPQQTLRD